MADVDLICKETRGSQAGNRVKCRAHVPYIMLSYTAFGITSGDSWSGINRRVAESGVCPVSWIGRFIQTWVPP